MTLLKNQHEEIQKNLTSVEKSSQDQILKFKDENSQLQNQITKTSEIISKLIEENSVMISAQEFKKKLSNNAQNEQSLIILMNEKKTLCDQLFTNSTLLEKARSEKSQLKLRIEQLEQQLSSIIVEPPPLRPPIPIPHENSIIPLIPLPEIIPAVSRTPPSETIVEVSPVSNTSETDTPELLRSEDDEPEQDKPVKANETNWLSWGTFWDIVTGKI